MTGLKTLSCRCPLEPATVIVVWFPITCAHTMVSASTCVGLTLPGMIDEPGSLAGSTISPIPQRGPEPSRRMSLPIFIRLAASTLSAPEASTIASWALRASNLSSAVSNGRPVSSAILAATARSKPSGAFNPVPTAVPP